VLLVGHNPGLEDLVRGLGRDGDPALIGRVHSKFPTGALATLAFGGSWTDLGSEPPPWSLRRPGRPAVILRPGRAAAAVLLLASLFVTTAVIASTSPSPSAGSAPAVPAVTPELLARYAPPALPDELRRRVQAMFDVRSRRRPAVPRRHAALLQLVGHRQQPGVAHRRPAALPVQLTGGEDPTTLQEVMPDGLHIVVSRTGRRREPGLYLQAGGRRAAGDHLPEGRVRASLSYVSRDGTSIFYEANDRRPNSYAIYRYDVTTRGPSWSSGRTGCGAWPTTAPTAASCWPGPPATPPASTSATTLPRRPSPAPGPERDRDYDIAFGLDEGDVIVRTPNSATSSRLYRYRTATRELSPITPDMGHDVAGFSISRDGGRILYTVNDGGYTRPHALDARTFGDLSIPSLPPADHVSFGSTTDDGRYTTIRLDAPPRSRPARSSTGRPAS